MKKIGILLISVAALILTSCGVNVAVDNKASQDESANEVSNESAKESEALTPDTPEVPKQDEAYILFTSDVHCGVDEGFGYAGLKQIRDNLEAQGYETLLVDDGDFLQGETIGTLTKGEAIIDLMNDLRYDVVIPGNHDFDYGTERFLELVDRADFPLISCNFTYKDELLFKPYIIKELLGRKIAFVGVTTPTTVTESTPAHFMDENGEFVYGFMQDKTGEKVYRAVQDAVDSARSEGADFVYLIAHLGNQDVCSPWTYADVVANTTGIDVVLDGHSHDTEQVVMKNKDGAEVTRSAVGTKLNCIGYSIIEADGEIEETNIWSWPNKDGAPKVFGIRNDVETRISDDMEALKGKLEVVIGSTDHDLTINDPEEKDGAGEPVRMVRRAETNLADFVTDAYRDQAGAQITLVNGGGIRTDIEKGEITYGDIINVNPFGNNLCVLEVTGQQIADALEWGASMLPEENGGFIQVSGLTYEIDTSVPSTCVKDENSMFVKVDGKRRVSNIMVDGKPIDLKGKYTLAGIDYMLINNGNGYTMFNGAPVVKSMIKLDNQALIDYLTDTLGGKVGEEYSDPHGQGRITVR